jgi:hypothetical protein
MTGALVIKMCHSPFDAGRVAQPIYVIIAVN